MYFRGTAAGKFVPDWHYKVVCEISPFHHEDNERSEIRKCLTQIHAVSTLDLKSQLQKL